MRRRMIHNVYGFLDAHIYPDVQPGRNEPDARALYNI